MAGPSLTDRAAPSSTSTAAYPARSRRQTSSPPPQGDDAGMFKSDHMVSIRNPFPRAKKTANIDTSSPPPPYASSGAVPKPSGGKLLSRPSNRIASHSTSELSNSNSVSSSRSAASSALATLTRFHPMGVGMSNQPSSSSATSSNSTSTYYSHGNADNYSRTVSSNKERDDDPDGSIARSSAPGAITTTSSSSSSSNNSSLPVLSASNGQSSASSNISVSAGSSSGSSTYHQRLQVSGVTRENSPSSILPGPSMSGQSDAALVNKSNPKGLVGLQNLGNTCFMNSCLQCVSNIPAVVKYFQSGLYAKEINDASPTKGALASAFGDLIKSLWSQDQFSATRPVELKRVIGKVASRFTGYDQQDAQEFLRFLLDGLHEDLNKIKKKPPYYEIKDRENAKDRDVSDEHWKFYFERNASTLSELFCGQLRSEIRCSTCSHRSLCFDVFWDLSLPVPKKPKNSSHTHMRISSVFGGSSSSSRSQSGDDEHASSGGCSVQDCLKAYTDQEFLHESDAYYCAKCKTHRAVAKKISLYRLPQVLVIHLKRFSYSTFSRDKVSTAIKFPAQALDIADYCAADAVVEGSTVYDLTGVVHHVGSLNGGHYTAECLNKDTQEWFDFNDASVSGIKKPQLCSSSAYILFFRRREEKSLTI